MSQAIWGQLTTTSPPNSYLPVTVTPFAGSKNALDVNLLNSSITGTFTPSGLTVDVRNTTLDITDTASAIPATALVNRNAMSIRNLSGADTLYIGKSDVTADSVNGTTSGWQVGPGESYNVDITDDIVLYGRAETGKTIKVQVQEVS